MPAAKSASQGAATASGAYVAPSDKALVVFVRGKGARQDHINVFDEQRHFVTVIEHVHRHVKVLVEPGEHTFYFGEIVRADLAAGRTYIIQVSAKSGVWGWTLLVDPALRKSGSFAASPQWIRDTQLDTPNVEKRAAQWDKKVNAKRMNKSIASSEAAWASATDEWRTARTIKKTDGRTAAEARDL